MGKINAYMMDVQHFVLDCYDRNGVIDKTTGIKTTSDILAKVRDEFGGGIAIDIAQLEIEEIEGGCW